MHTIHMHTANNDEVSVSKLLILAIAEFDFSYGLIILAIAEFDFSYGFIILAIAEFDFRHGLII